MLNVLVLECRLETLGGLEMKPLRGALRSIRCVNYGRRQSVFIKWAVRTVTTKAIKGVIERNKCYSKTSLISDDKRRAASGISTVRSGNIEQQFRLRMARGSFTELPICSDCEVTAGVPSFTFMWPCIVTYDRASWHMTVHRDIWPCIVTNFFTIKPTRCTNFTNLFCYETLHVSDSSSVHHQDFIHCTLSNGICHTGL